MKVSHEIFSENVASGMNHTEAYLTAFPGCRSRNAARANAARLIARDSVKAEIARIREENETSLMLTYREKREYLARVVRDPDSSPQEVIKALQVDNEMDGHNAPPEVYGELTLGAILSDLKSTPLINQGPSSPFAN